MPHKRGANIGGIDSVEAMRLRCFCDAHTGCWHLRTARGRRFARGSVQRLWLHGIGNVTATRGAWLLAHDKLPPSDRLVVARKCDSHDCVNPQHLACVTRSTHSRKTAPKKGELSASQRQALAIAVDRQRKLTPELKRWLLESQQSSAAAAHGLGIANSRAAVLRREASTSMRDTAASVFAFGSAMNDQAMREAA